MPLKVSEQLAPVGIIENEMKLAIILTTQQWAAAQKKGEKCGDLERVVQTNDERNRMDSL